MSTPVARRAFALCHELVPPSDSGDHPGAIVLLQPPGGRRWCWSVGSADLEQPLAITSRTTFNAGSIAKSLTAAVSKTVVASAGHGLQTRLRQLIPELPAAMDEITLSHLLDHRSGIRDYRQLLAVAGRPEADYVDQYEVLSLLFRQQSLQFRPGSRFGYSNSNYVLLATLASLLAKRPFSNLVEEQVFGPLDMRNSLLLDDAREIVLRRAKGYALDRTAWWTVPMNETVTGDAGWWTTADDLSKWAQAIVSGHSATAGVATGADDALDPSSLGYRHGFFVRRHGEVTVLSHGGAIGGFRSGFAVCPSRGAYCLALSNWTGAAADQVVSALMDLMLETPEGEPSVCEDAPRRTTSVTRGFFASPGKEVWTIEGDPPSRLRSVGVSLRLTQKAGARLTAECGEGTFELCGPKANGGYTLHLDSDSFLLEPISTNHRGHAVYVGQYKSDELMHSIEIFSDGEALYWSRRGRAERLEWLGAGVFRSGDTWVSFEHDPGATASRCRVDVARARGMVFERA